MITVGMNYTILPGKDDEFVSVFRKVIEVMKEMDGHTKTSLFRNVDAPHEYLIISDWSDRAAFDAFIASDRFKSVTNWGKLNVLAGRPTHEVYESSSTPSAAKPPASCPAHSR